MPRKPLAMALLIGATGSRLAAEADRRSRQWVLWPLGLLLGLAVTLAAERDDVTVVNGTEYEYFQSSFRPASDRSSGKCKSSR